MTSGTAPPAAVWASKPPLTEPFEASRRRDRPDRRAGLAEAHLLVGHVAARLAVPLRDVHAGVAQHLRAVLLGRQGDGDADREDREHRREHHPGVAARQHDPAEHEDLRGRDQQDREHLEEVRERRSGSRTARPSSSCRTRRRSCPSCLIATCDATGPRAIVWCAPCSVVAVAWPLERLRHALRDQDHREDDRQRQQDVDERAVEVAPEVAELGRVERREMPRTTATSTAMPDRGRDEVLHGEAGHLRQVRHRVLAAVVLPVRVRDEARGRVDRDVRRDALQVVRVQEEVALQSLDRVEHGGEADAEDEHRLRVASSPARRRSRGRAAAGSRARRGRAARARTTRAMNSPSG